MNLRVAYLALALMCLLFPWGLAIAFLGFEGLITAGYSSIGGGLSFFLYTTAMDAKG
jgi:hypothetical protein